MTVQAQETTQYYNGPIAAGTTLAINDFTFVDNSHVSAKIRGESTSWTYGTDYTVAGQGTTIRTLTVNTAVPQGKVLAIYLDVPITQGISPEEGGSYPAATNEFTLDKLTYICQQIWARLERAIQVSIDTPFDGILYDVENNARKLIVINSTGTGLEFSEQTIDELLAEMRAILAEIREIKLLTLGYKNDAQAAAQQSANSASASAISAQAAVESAREAASYASMAQDYTNQAKSYMESAERSANNAAAQVDLAAAQVELAHQEALAAQEQVALAAAQVTLAQGYASNAQASANAAAASVLEINTEIYDILQYIHDTLGEILGED